MVTSILFWCVLAIALFIMVLNIPYLRRLLIIYPIYKLFKKIIPHISRTEKEALEAGETWWEAKLFQGRPNWDEFIQLPNLKLTKEETAFIDNKVESLCQKLDDWTITHKTLDLPQIVWEMLKKEGFFGLIIPKEYGGLGFSAYANSTIVQKIATRSLTAGVSAMLPNSLGPAELLLAYGTDEQKNHYLPRLASGLEIPCFALTGPEAGSDASSVPDTGFICKGTFENKEIIGMRLTWDKRYITLAPIATVLGLAVKLYDPDGLLGEKLDLGMTLCLIPTNLPGIEKGKRHLPLNQPFLNGPIRGKDIFVPLNCIIGGSIMAGKGWHMIVESLSAGRGISLPALSTAAAKLCYRTTGAYARIRKQFHTSIGHFEGVEEALAKIGGYAYLLESTRLLTLIPIVQHRRPAVATAIAKYHMTELARRAMNHAMDVHGGKTIMLGPKNYLGRNYESMPISITVEGANILSRSLIIFGQGIVLCHPYLKDEMAALTDKNEKAGRLAFDKIFGLHFRYSVNCFIKACLHSWTAGKFLSVPSIPKIGSYIQQIHRMSIALAFTTEIVLIFLGGKLKRKERLSARLGDILSHLYLASAVIKYYHTHCNTQNDNHYAEWALQYCLFKIQHAFWGFFYNFRFRPISWFLRLILFPFGKPYCPPKDSLDHHIAAAMMVPSEFRDRITSHCYIGNSNEDMVAKLDKALEQNVAIENLIDKVEKAVKKKDHPPALMMDKIEQAEHSELLTKDEARLLREFEILRSQIIAVDEFEESELHGKA